MASEVSSESPAPDSAPDAAAETPPESTDGTAPAAPGGRPGGGRANRLRLQSFRNMVLSMALICVGAFGFWLVIPHDESRDPVRTVEYDVAAATAARAAPYDLLVPRGLDEDWRATAVRYDPQGEFGATWRLGFMNPSDEYVALTQAVPVAGNEDAFVSSVTVGATATGETVEVAGDTWARYEGEKYDALVRVGPEDTTVVMGTAPLDGLTGLTEALAAEPGRAA
ncbi:DUF4245 domain-containing protein [Streptomyces sp. NPDC049879]|uniref:DUF4245 domain-containing protein n=1 Tax=Streptomyces sp. NPDC049879 TaxID=3365598 RepID=UPI0037AB75E3